MKKFSEFTNHLGKMVNKQQEQLKQSVTQLASKAQNTFSMNTTATTAPQIQETPTSVTTVGTSGKEITNCKLVSCVYDRIFATCTHQTVSSKLSKLLLLQQTPSFLLQLYDNLSKQHASRSLFLNFSSVTFDHLHKQFHGPVIEFGETFQYEDLSMLFSICYQMYEWLHKDSERYVIIHCPSASEYIRLIVSCYLMFNGQFDHCQVADLTSVKSQSVHQQITASLKPSLHRYNQCFHKLIHQPLPPVHSYTLKRLLINTKLPLQEIVKKHYKHSLPKIQQLLHSKQDLFISKGYPFIMVKQHEHVLYTSPVVSEEFSAEPGEWYALPLNCEHLVGDFVIHFYISVQEMMIPLFRFSFNSLFIEQQLDKTTRKQSEVVLNVKRNDIDWYYSKLIPQEFQVQLVMDREKHQHFRVNEYAMEMERSIQRCPQHFLYKKLIERKSSSLGKKLLEPRLQHVSLVHRAKQSQLLPELLAKQKQTYQLIQANYLTCSPTSDRKKKNARKSKSIHSPIVATEDKENVENAVVPKLSPTSNKVLKKKQSNHSLRKSVLQNSPTLKQQQLFSPGTPFSPSMVMSPESFLKTMNLEEVFPSSPSVTTDKLFETVSQTIQNDEPISSEEPCIPLPPPPPPALNCLDPNIPMPPPPLMSMPEKQQNVKQIHWNTIARHKFERSKSIWSSIDVNESMEFLDEKELEQMFKKEETSTKFGTPLRPTRSKQSSSKNTSPSSKSSPSMQLERTEEFVTDSNSPNRLFYHKFVPSQTSVLDMNRSKNIEIVMNQFKSINIVDVIENGDVSKLEKTQLIALKMCVPTEDEKKKLMPYWNGDARRLAKADSFLLKLSKMEYLQEKIQAMICIKEFEILTSDLLKQIQCKVGAMDQILLSKGLPKVLEVILRIGNTLNRGNRRLQNASAFRIEILPKLVNTKSHDKKQSMVHYLETVLFKMDQTASVGIVSQFYLDFQQLSHVTKFTNESILLQFKELQHHYSFLQDLPLGSWNQSFVAVLSRFLRDTATPLFEKAKQELEANQRKYEEVLGYFGEELNDYPSDEQFFAIFTEFIATYKNAQQENQRKRKMESKKAITSTPQKSVISTIV